MRYCFVSIVTFIIIASNVFAAQLKDTSITGKLGVGTTTPTVTLQVGAGNPAASSSIATINTVDVDKDALMLSNWDGATATYGPRIQFDNSGIGAWYIGSPNGTNSFDIAQAWGTPRLRVNSGGNIGIGVASPASRLSILEDAGDGAGTSAMGIGFQYDSTFTRAGIYADGLTGWLGVLHFATNPGAASHTITPRMTIRDDKVGIGTTLPGAKLHSLATTEQFRLGYDVNNYWSSTVGSTGGLTLAGIGAGGVLSLTPTAGQNLNVNLSTTGDLAVNTNQLYVDTSTGYVGIGVTAPGAPLEIKRASDGRILKLTKTGISDWDFSIGATSTLTGLQSGSLELLPQTGNTDFGIGRAGQDITSFVVKSIGNIGVGTSTPSAQLHTTGTVRMQNFGAGTATFDANGNISSVSDERLKTISGSFSSGLTEVLQIKPIIYKWNEKSGLETMNNYVGFSAQNLSKYIPEAVSINSEGYLSVSDRAVIAALVNAVKTLSDEVDALKLKQGLPLTSHTIVANTDITKLGKTNYAKTLRTPVLQGEETWGYIEEGTESKAQAVSAEDAFILVPGYTQNYLRDEVKIEFILEGEDVKQVTKIVPTYEQVFVKLQKKLKENVSLNSETGTFYKNVEVPKLVYKMKKGVSFDEVTKVYMRNETSAEALARVGKEIVSIIPKIQ